MLERFYDVLLNGIPYTLTLVAGLSLFRHHPKIVRIWWRGTAPAFAVAGLILYTEYSLHLTRQVNGILSGLAILGYALMLFGHRLYRRDSPPAQGTGDSAAAVLGIGLFFLACWGWTHVFRAALFLVRRSAESVAGIDQGILGNWLGFIFGLLLLFLMGLAVYRYFSRLSAECLIIPCGIILFILILKAGVEFLYGLLVFRVYNPPDWIYSIITRHMNNPEVSNLVLLGGGLVAGLIALASHRMPLAKKTDNPAQRRKTMAGEVKKKNRNRWMIVNLIIVLTAGGIAYASSRTEIEIRPSTQISMNAAGEFTVHKDVLEDGHIHRYTWTTPDNVDIVFWMIKKQENNYGIVFDACELCGPAGYLEKGDNVVCIACDVVMNRHTIVLQGGCNPIPIENFLITPDSITVRAADLLVQEDFFRGVKGRH